MEIIDIIHKRRSIRNFIDKPISNEDLHSILSAGMTAPSAMNKQPWRLVVIDDNEIKKEIPNVSKHAHMVVESPLSILVCADIDSSYLDCWKIDCSACIQNMLLSACALNIGSVWTGINTQEQIDGFKKLFNLPNNIIPHSLIVFGYSNTPFISKDYFDESKIHYNKW